MTLSLEEAIAEVENFAPWDQAEFELDTIGFKSSIRNAIAMVLQSVASGDLIPLQCCMCGKKDLSIVEGDGGQECELSDGRWTCSRECWEKAVGDLIPKADADQAVALMYQRAWDDFIKLHTAAFAVVQWFETSRPDIIGPRIEKLRDILCSDHFRPDDALATPDSKGTSSP